MLMQTPANLAQGASDTGSLDRVRRVFVEAVRYPAEVFSDAHADMENDLGIDSVMFGVVWSALLSEFSLDAAEAARVRGEQGRLRTLAGIAAALDEALAARKPAAPEGVAPAPDGAGLPAEGGGLVAEVAKVFADVTRYPADVLAPDADIEDDLGIDSVKWGVILSALRERLGAPAASEWNSRSTRTISAVAAFIESRRTRGERPLEVLAFPASAPAASAHAEPRSTARPFDGKIALVTGSGRSIGRSIALELAAQGAEVVVNSFHSRELGEATAAEIVASGGKARHVWASVANVEHLHRLYDEVEAQCGGLDFLVNNASNGLMAPYAEIGPEHMEKAFRTNVVSLHVGALRAAELMKRRGGGRIVSMSSIASQGYIAYNTCMGPVKAAVESLTRYLAVDLAPHNIRVNCIKAGPAYGNVIDKWPDQSIIPAWERDMAGNRLLRDEDIVEMTLFLLGSRSDMMNGSIVTLDGGFTLRHIGLDEPVA